MFHARIQRALEITRIDMLEVWQLGMIERQQHVFAHQRLDHVGRWHHHIITGRPRTQLGVHRLVGIEGIDH